MRHSGNCLLLSLLVAVGTTAFSQSTTQSIQGLVTDSSGSFIAGANITAINQGTNISLSVTSNETGNYTFPLLPVGNYTVRCEKPGFRVDVVKELRLETAAQVRQDFKLDVGSVSESIEVTTKLHTFDVFVNSIQLVAVPPPSMLYI